MSLADELLADLEETNENEGNVNEENDQSMKMDIDSNPNQWKRNVNSVSHVAKLQESILLQETMRKIDFHTKHQRKSTMEIEGPVEYDPEYLLIVDANHLLVKIDDEIEIIHNFVKEIYKKRFPELEQLVQLPMDYLKTVQVRFRSGRDRRVR